MRYLFAAWAAPLILFWGWYFLSLNDINFGYVMLTRDMHDFVFQIYGHILGIDPASIPALVARACVFDSFFLAALHAYRRRRRIIAWWRARRGEPVIDELAEADGQAEGEPGPYARIAVPPYAGGSARPRSA